MQPSPFSCSLFSPFFLFIHLKYDWKVVNIYNNNKNNKRVCWKWKLKEKNKSFYCSFAFFFLVLSSSTVYIFIVIWHSFLLHFFVVVVAFYNSPLTSIFVSAISLAKTIFFCFSIKRGIGLRTFTLMSNHVVNLKYK